LNRNLFIFFLISQLFHEHTRFVQCVRYNKDGSIFASAGSDGRVILFGGQDGEKLSELTDDKCNGAAHGGGVFALSWHSDGKKLVTASGDKTLKVWNVPDRKLIG
jgi:WD40 repeat protein